MRQYAEDDQADGEDPEGADDGQRGGGQRQGDGARRAQVHELAVTQRSARVVEPVHQAAARHDRGAAAPASRDSGYSCSCYTCCACALAPPAPHTTTHYSVSEPTAASQ